MTYCTYSDVEETAGEEYTGSSQPSKARVVEVCIEVSLEIDAVLLAAGYTTVPATGTNDLALLKQYARFGSAAAAWHEGHVTDDEYPRVEFWEKSYRDFLPRLRRGEQGLIDQTIPSGLGSMSAVTVGRADGFSAEAELGEYGRWG